MVDLVKIRKKANRKREEAVAGEALPAAAEARTPAEVALEPAPAPVLKVKEQPKRRQETEAELQPAVATPAVPPSAGDRLSVAKPGEETRSTSARLEAFKASAGRRVEEAEAAQMIDLLEETTRELLTFELAGERYAVEIERIIEIVPPRSSTRVPNTDTGVLGIISLRGTIVTVLDLRRRLGHPDSAGTSADSRIIIVENRGETAGFLVDRVLRVIKVEPSEIESHPVVSAEEQTEYVRGVFQYGKKLTILLDLDRLLGY